MNLDAFVFADPAAYPPVKVCGPHAGYAEQMLSNIGACNSEMSAVSLYFYNSVVLKSHHRDIALVFHKISMVEMHHLDIFATLALQLGANPRLWSYQGRNLSYWTPGCNQYPCQLLPLLQNALQGENQAIAKYRDQANRIGDPYIVALLQRILLDEQHHVDIFQDLMREVSGRPSTFG